jgi:hypothetical protein
MGGQQAFKLRHGTLCVDMNGFRATKVPKDAVVLLINPCVDDNGFVEIQWNGRRLLIFDVDLRSRGDPIALTDG